MIRVDDGPFVDLPHERRRFMLGRAALWRSPVALLPNDARPDGPSVGDLPPWLPLASVLAHLPQIEGAP